MTKPDSSSVDEKLAALSRGIFINRCLLIFTSVCTGIFLFAPRVAAGIAARCESLWQACSSVSEGVIGIIVSLIALFVCAGYIVSKMAPASPPQSGGEPY